MAAITHSQFTSYLPSVKLTVDTTDYTIPIWNLTLTLVPWSGIGTPHQTMADGTVRQKVEGWHIRVEFQSTFSHSTLTDDQCTATSAILAAYDYGSVIVDFDPIDHVGKRLLTLVIEDGDGMGGAQFIGRVRQKEFSVTMITETPLATGAIPSWFAGDTV